jgi:hypothetical protein
MTSPFGHAHTVPLTLPSSDAASREPLRLSSRAAVLAQTRASSGRRDTVRPKRTTAGLPAKREPRATARPGS